MSIPDPNTNDQEKCEEHKHKAVALPCERLSATSGWEIISQKLLSHGIWSDLPEEHVAPHSSVDSLNVTLLINASHAHPRSLPSRSQLTLSICRNTWTHISFSETRICPEVWVILFETSWLFRGPQQLSSMFLISRAPRSSHWLCQPLLGLMAQPNPTVSWELTMSFSISAP